MIVNGANAYIQSAVASAAQLNPAERQNTSEQRVRENIAQPKQAEAAETLQVNGNDNRENIRQNSINQQADDEFNNFEFADGDDGLSFEAFLQDNGLDVTAPRGSVINLTA